MKGTIAHHLLSCECLREAFFGQLAYTRKRRAWRCQSALVYLPGSRHTHRYRLLFIPVGGPCLTHLCGVSSPFLGVECRERGCSRVCQQRLLSVVLVSIPLDALRQCRCLGSSLNTRTQKGGDKCRKKQKEQGDRQSVTCDAKQLYFT